MRTNYILPGATVFSKGMPYDEDTGAFSGGNRTDSFALYLYRMTTRGDGTLTFETWLDFTSPPLVIHECTYSSY